MVRTRYWPAPRDPQLLAPPMPRRTVVNAMSRPKAEMTTMLRVAEDVYLQQLRGLGAWWRLGSSALEPLLDRKSTRLNSSHGYISYAVFCLKKKKNTQ